MVKFTQTQIQIKSYFADSYFVNPHHRRLKDAVIYETGLGPNWGQSFLGFFPPDPGCVPQRVPGQVSFLSVEPPMLVDVALNDLAPKIFSGDCVSVICPAEGVFWAVGERALDRVARSSAGFTSRTTSVTCDYAQFETVIQMVVAKGPVSGAGEIAFLSGSHGEWTMADDVRRAGNKKQKRRANQPRRARPRRPRGAIALSHCAQKYARAIADPFNPASVGACVPVYPAPPSYKVTSHQRVLTVTIGSAGVGAFRFNPCPFNNMASAAVTTAAFDGVTIEDYVTNAEWSRVAFSTLPFSSADPVQCRVVSASAKVTYTGTALDLSGMFVSAVDPDHEAIRNTLNLTDLSTLPYARVENTKRRMNNLSPMFGIKPHETDYTSTRYPLSTYTGTDIDAGLNAAPCCFLVSGVPGTTFNVELIIHVEYVGRPAVTGLTKSHTDSRGFEMVQQAGAQLASHLASTAQAAWPTMRRLLAEAGRDLLASQLGVRLPMIEL